PARDHRGHRGELRPGRRRARPAGRAAGARRRPAMGVNMTTLRSLSTEHPHATITDRDTAALLARLDRDGDAGRWRDAVAASGVRRRSAVAPPAGLVRLGGAAERHARYARLAPALAERVARAELAEAGIAPA